MKLLLVCLLILCGQNAYAVTYGATGTVATVQMDDPATIHTPFPNGTADDFFLLSGFSSAGSCGVGGPTNGVVLAVKKDTTGKRMFATALLAMSLGKTVTVYVDDTIRNANSYCYVVAASLNP